MELSEHFDIATHEGCNSVKGILVETKPRVAADGGYRAFFGVECVKCGQGVITLRR